MSEINKIEPVAPIPEQIFRRPMHKEMGGARKPAGKINKGDSVELSQEALSQGEEISLEDDSI